MADPEKSFASVAKYSLATSALLFLLCVMPTCAQTAAEIDAIQHPDMQALQAKLDGARFQKLPNREQNQKCNKKEGAEPYQRASCDNIANALLQELGNNAPIVETAFLKTCIYPRDSFTLWPCTQLAQLYEAKGQYGLAIAAASFSRCRDTHEEAVRCLEVKADIYRRFGLKAEQELTLITLCRGIDGDQGMSHPCEQLRALGSTVNIGALMVARQEDFDIEMDRMNKEVAVRQEQHEQAVAEADQQQAKTDAIVAAIRSIGTTTAAPTPTYHPPSRQTTSTTPQPTSAAPSRQTTSTMPAPTLTAPDRDTVAIAAPPTGHWVAANYVVTCGGNAVLERDTLITASIVDSKDNAACFTGPFGNYFKIGNSDQKHPVYYGFGGVLNQVVGPNSTQTDPVGLSYYQINKPPVHVEQLVSFRYWSEK